MPMRQWIRFLDVLLFFSLGLFSKFPHEVVEHTCDRIHGVRKYTCFGCVLAVLLYQFYQPIQLLVHISSCHFVYWKPQIASVWADKQLDGVFHSEIIHGSSFCLLMWSSTAVSAKTGVPTSNKIHQILVHWVQFTEESTPTRLPLRSFDNKVAPTVHQPHNIF